MSHYQIVSGDGYNLGTWEADSSEAAIEALDRDAGYASSAAAATALETTVEAMRAELTVTEVSCCDGTQNAQHAKHDSSWWENDAQGIPLCRVCDKCRSAKLGRYRPEILIGYDQSDVDEPIEPDYGYGEGSWS